MLPQSAPEGLTDAMLLRCGRAGAASITDDESVQRWGQVCAFSDTEVECVAGLSPQQDSQGLSQVDSQLSCGSTLLLLPHAHSMPAVRSLSSPGGPAATPGRSSQVPLLHTLSLDAMARRGGSSSGGGAPGGVASLAARRGRPGSATLCVDTAMCTFFDAAAPATSSGSGGAAAPPSCEPCAANGRSSCLAGCGGQCGAGCSGPPHSSGAPPARNAARAGCTRGGAGSAAAAVGERGSDCTTTGWFGRCRGCAQLTGGELLLHMGGVPFCGPCAGRLAGVPADQRACCEQQLLHIHQSWALSGH